MRYSFIVLAVDRYKDLQNCVASLEKAHEFNRDIDIEILVIFEGEGDKKKFIQVKYPNLFKFYTIKGIGLSEARNIGIKKSEGEYLIFLDDDARVKEDILQALSVNLTKNEAGAFCGRLLDPSDNSLFPSFPWTSQITDLGWFSSESFRGSNIILKRKVIEEVGFFDERFGSGQRYYGAGDSDMFFRLKQNKEKVFYLPDVVIYHQIPHYLPYSKVFNYFYARGAVFAKQIINDKSRFLIYAVYILDILTKSLLRLVQRFLLPNTATVEIKGFSHKAAFCGTIKGIIDYLRFN